MYFSTSSAYVTNRPSLTEMFDLARLLLGSYAEVARALGVSPQRVHDWRTGSKPCSLHVQCGLAMLCNVDVCIIGIDGVANLAQGLPYGAELQALADDLAQGK